MRERIVKEKMAVLRQFVSLLNQRISEQIDQYCTPCSTITRSEISREHSCNFTWGSRVENRWCLLVSHPGGEYIICGQTLVTAQVGQILSSC